MGIKNLGEKACEDCVEWKIAGVTEIEILDRLRATYGESDNITEDTLDYFFRKIAKPKIAAKIRADENFSNKLAQKYFDTVQALNNTHTELMKVFYEIRKDCPEIDKTIECEHCHRKTKIKVKNYGDLIKTANTILEQVKFVQKTLTKMQHQSLNVNYNILDLSRKLTIAVPEIVQSLVDQKLIKVIAHKRFRERFPISDKHKNKT